MNNMKNTTRQQTRNKRNLFCGAYYLSYLIYVLCNDLKITQFKISPVLNPVSWLFSYPKKQITLSTALCFAKQDLDSLAQIRKKWDSRTSPYRHFRVPTVRLVRKCPKFMSILPLT